MPIDQEQLRAERVRVHQANRAGDWSEREAELIARDRAELAAEREAETHERELAAFTAFATRKAAAAVKAGDTDRAKTWNAAATNAGKGLWTIARTIRSDPESAKFGAGHAAQLRREERPIR